MSSTPHHARFDSVRSVLAASILPDPTLPDGHAEAAVSLILRGTSEPELLLIKRAEAPNDPWSGHMALPGGKREPADSDLLATAVRETREETGLCLDTHGDYLGRLSRLDPSSQRLPPLTVTPYVFGVGEDARAHTDSLEVEAIYWVALADLLAPDAVGEFTYRIGKAIRRFPAFTVEGQVVWGLTYRVLEEFLAKLPWILTDDPPSPR